MTGTPTISTEGLTVAYGRRTVLSDVSLTVEPGRFVVVAGPNGAGKSTLLRAMAGIVHPRSGSVTLDGRPLSAIPPGERARLVAYLPQGHEVHWPMRFST